MSLRKPAKTPKNASEMAAALANAFPRDEKRQALIAEALVTMTATMGAARDMSPTEDHADAWQWLILALSFGCQRGIEQSGIMAERN